MKWNNYKPIKNTAYKIPINKKQCLAQIFGKGRLDVIPYQCANKPKYNGCCGIHKESKGE